MNPTMAENSNTRYGKAGLQKMNRRIANFAERLHFFLLKKTPFQLLLCFGI